MAFIFNPFTGTFDYYESGGGGGTSITVVANYSALPAAGTATGEFYWCSAAQGTWWLPGSLGGTYYNSGLYYSNGVSWERLEHPYNATQAEVNTGTNTDKFVTPDTFTNASKWATKKSIATGNNYKFVTTGATGDIQETTVTASRAVATDANGLPTASTTTATELGYLSGVTSAIQTQLDSKVSSISFFHTSNQSIADSTSYFLAHITAPATSIALSSMVPVKAGTVIGASLGGFNASMVGSNEAWTVKLWYNDGLNSVTLTTNFTGGNANRNYFLDIDGLSTAINDGNCVVEFIAPALATNPNGFRGTATIYIRP